MSEIVNDDEQDCARASLESIRPELPHFSRITTYWSVNFLLFFFPRTATGIGRRLYPGARAILCPSSHRNNGVAGLGTSVAN